MEDKHSGPIPSCWTIIDQIKVKSVSSSSDMLIMSNPQDSNG